MCRPIRRRFLVLLFMTACVFTTANAQATETEVVQAKAKQVWQLLDYVAVDYGGAVSHGMVLKDSEYSEMQEFAAAAMRELGELPRGAASEGLQRRAADLEDAIANKAEATQVAQLARNLARELRSAYPFASAPADAPDPGRGAHLFREQCVACHGPLGRGDGPLAASLNPKPTALSEPLRARERTLFALYQVITNGVVKTPMASFAALPDKDRWALAFFVGTLPYTDNDRAAGAALWRSRARTSQVIASLDALTQTSEHELSTRLDKASALSLMAYLRSNPQVLAADSTGRTTIARTKLAESVAALRSGDRAAATKLALSAYLDGFEPIEPLLAARDRALFEKIEAAMGSYRTTVAGGQVTDVRVEELALLRLLDDADRALVSSDADAVTAFLGALTTLLREGLEALLIVVAMLAFLHKALRRDVVAYVHAGWIAALAAGAVTWALAAYLVDVSGASREVTEGVSSLFATVVLLSVGMWMHRNSVAGRWQVYLKEQLSLALTKRTAWFLFSIAFIAVYREVFETVLFYAALWTQGNHWALIAGLAVGIGLVSVLAFVLLRTSAWLPIGKFFAASSLLMAALAFVLAGKGVAGLQEAGLVHVSPVPFPRIDLLGVYPSRQTLLAQSVVVLTVVVMFVVNLQSERRLRQRPT